MISEFHSDKRPVLTRSAMPRPHDINTVKWKMHLNAIRDCSLIIRRGGLEEN